MDSIIDSLGGILHEQGEFSFTERGHAVEGAQIVLKNHLVTIPDTLETSEARGSFLFIDGGEGVILDTPDVVVVRLRIVGVLFEGVARKEVLIKEHTVLISRKKGFSIIAEPALPALCATALPHGSLAEMPGLLRKRLECAYALEWLERIELAGQSRVAQSEKFAKILSVKTPSAKAPSAKRLLDAVIFDGALTTTDEFIKREQGVLVKKTAMLAIAKTSTLLCTNGTSLPSAMQQIADVPAYVILSRQGNEGNAMIALAAKLHARAQFSFVIEAALSFAGAKKIERMLAALLPLCSDISFLGYPYPLVLADQLARVTNEEVAAEKTRMTVTLAEQGKFTLRTVHGILDTMRF